MLRFSDLAITSYDLARYITEVLVDLLLARLIASLRSSTIHSNRAGAPIHVRSNIYNGKSTCK